MGEDDVLLLGGQLHQLGGVAGRGHRVVEALVARMGGLVVAVVQIQVVQQSHTGRHPVIPAQPAGQTEGHIGYKQRVVIGGDGEMVAPLLHGFHLLRGD